MYYNSYHDDDDSINFFECLYVKHSLIYFHKILQANHLFKVSK